MVEIDQAMKFVAEKLEKNTIPLDVKYSLASLAASMKRIADRMEGVNGGINISNPPMSFYQLEQALNGIRDRMGGSGNYSPSTFADNQLQAIATTLNSLVNAMRKDQ